MDPVSEIDFIRSREVNVPYGGMKGAVSQLFSEGPLTVLFAAGVGAAIGGLVLGGAAIMGGGAAAGLMGAVGGALPFVGLAAAASAALTTVFVGAQGFLEGRRDALEKNTLLDHMAELHKGEIAMRGLAVQQEIQSQANKREGTTPAFIKKIVSGGRQGSPISHAESLLAMRTDDGNQSLSR